MRRWATLSIVLLAAVLAVSSRPVSKEPASPRPNIILILTDNQNPDVWGAYGATDIRTPNIDRLARGGAIFTSAHPISGVCSPSRATLLTGAVELYD